MIVKTSFGEFRIVRRDTVAISVVKAKRECIHHRKRLYLGDLAHIEHRKMPKLVCQAKTSVCGWAEWIALFDLEGNQILLEKCPILD